MSSIITVLFLVVQIPSLHIAILQYNSSEAEVLLEQGADPNSLDIHKRSPLHVAVQSYGERKLELMRLLLAKGADVNARDDSGASPLDEAAWQGYDAKAAVLLDGGAIINAPNTRTGATPLNEAAFKGHVDVIELLLEHGADASLRDHAGFLPLENAVRQHHVDAARILLKLEKGQLIDHLLEEAVRRSQVDMVQILMEYGAAIDARTSSGSTPLYDAVLKGNAEIVSLLVNAGADVNARETISGTTALYAAAALDREEAVAMLLLSGADPNLIGKDGISPLRAAESNGYGTIAERIRAAGGR